MEKQVIEPHRFKKHEWLYLDSKVQLMELIRNYHREFGIQEWDLETIRHFLELFHYIVPGKGPEWHHIRCVATLVRRMYK